MVSVLGEVEVPKSALMKGIEGMDRRGVDDAVVGLGARGRV